MAAAIAVHNIPEVGIAHALQPRPREAILLPIRHARSCQCLYAARSSAAACPSPYACTPWVCPAGCDCCGTNVCSHWQPVEGGGAGHRQRAVRAAGRPAGTAAGQALLDRGGAAGCRVRTWPDGPKPCLSIACKGGQVLWKPLRLVCQRCTPVPEPDAPVCATPTWLGPAPPVLLGRRRGCTTSWALWAA